MSACFAHKLPDRAATKTRSGSRTTRLERVMCRPPKRGACLLACSPKTGPLETGQNRVGARAPAGLASLAGVWTAGRSRRNQGVTLFPFVLRFSGFYRLPLHVAGIVGAALFKRLDVVHHVSRARARFL